MVLGGEASCSTAGEGSRRFSAGVGVDALQTHEWCIQSRKTGLFPRDIGLRNSETVGGVSEHSLVRGAGRGVVDT